MFGTVFILHILQKGLLVLCSIGCLVLRMCIHCFVLLSKQSQLPERMEDMCRNGKHARRWSHISVIFGHLRLSKLHSEEQVFLPWSLFLSQSWHHAIHAIEHIIVHWDDMMQCDCMPSRHPQGPISIWPQHFHNILHNGPFILSCEEWPVIAVYWVFKPLAREFTWSEVALEQLQGRVPPGLVIDNRKYRDMDLGFLSVSKLVLTPRC